MHLLTIIFGPSPTPWALLFAKVELADSALTELKLKKKEGLGEVTLHDDFGQQATIEVASIHGFMLEDLEKSKLRKSSVDCIKLARRRERNRWPPSTRYSRMPL